MLSKTKESYGAAPWVDTEAVNNPQAQQAANQANRQAEDTAQLTRTSERAKLLFQTTAAAAPVAVSAMAGTTTVWGSGSALYPTIQKTATGVYVATYAATFQDSLVGTTADSVSETETTNFRYAMGAVHGSTFGHAQGSPAANVVTIRIWDGAIALSDLGGGVTVEVHLS